MSKASRKKRRAAKMKKLPWQVKKGEGSVVAFLRQAEPVTIQDYRNLLRLGYKPIEAAMEAWLTQEAGCTT